MKEHKIRLVLEATDNASKSVKDLGEEAEETGEDLEGAGESASRFGAMLTAGAVIAAGKAVYELGRLGAEALRTEQAFANISGGADAAQANLDAMTVATRGAMSETEMMSQASRLLQMGLVSNSEELGQFTEMAVRLGSAMGVGPTQAMEDFAMMMANQSLPRLDTFGISSGKVRARINELMAATEGMTREMAFNQAVMEQGAQAMDRLGPATEDAALAFERAETSVEDAKTALSKKLAPAVSEVTGFFAQGVVELTQWDKRIKQAVGGTAAFALHLAGADDKATGLLERLGLMEEQSTSTAGAQEMLRAKAAGAAVAVGDQAAAAETVAEKLVTGEDVLRMFTSTLDSGNLSISEMNAQTRQLGTQLGVTITAEQQAKRDAELLSTAFKEGAISADEYRNRMVQLSQGNGQLAESERAAVASQLESARAADQQAEAHRKASEAAAEQAQSTMNLASSLKDATSSQIASRMIGMLDPKKMGAEAYSSAVSDIGLEFGLMDEKSVALSENMGTLAGAIEEGIIPTENADEALSALIEDAEDGKVDIDAITDSFGSVPGRARPMSDSIRAADGAMAGFGSSVTATQGNLQQLVANSPYRLEVITEETGGGGGGGGDGDGGPDDGIPELQRAAGGGGTTVLAPIIVRESDVMTPSGALDTRALELLIERGRREYL